MCRQNQPPETSSFLPSAFHDEYSQRQCSMEYSPSNIRRPLASVLWRCAKVLSCREDLLRIRVAHDITLQDATSFRGIRTGVFVQKISEDTPSYRLMANDEYILGSFQLHNHRFETSYQILVGLIENKWNKRFRLVSNAQCSVLLRQDNDSSISIDPGQRIHRDSVRRFLCRSNPRRYPT